jgi:hypothetical protein
MDARQARRVRTDVTTHKTRIPVRAGFKPAQSTNRLQTSVEGRSPRCWSIATVSPPDADVPKHLGSCNNRTLRQIDMHSRLLQFVRRPGVFTAIGAVPRPRSGVVAGRQRVIPPSTLPWAAGGQHHEPVRERGPYPLLVSLTLCSLAAPDAHQRFRGHLGGQGFRLLSGSLQEHDAPFGARSLGWFEVGQLESVAPLQDLWQL